MPTEFFELVEKIPSITTQIQNERTTTRYKSGTIDYWRDVMQSGGWTEDTIRSPKARVTVRLNIATLPVMTIPPLDELEDGSAICEGSPVIIVKAPGATDQDAIKVWGFDPGRFLPPPCESFPYGPTKEETAARFKAKLGEALQMAIIDTVVDGTVETLTLSYGAPGTFKNGTRVGGWVNGTAWYGGWKLDSQVYRGHFLSISGREGPGFSGGLYDAWELFARVHADGDPVGSDPVPFGLFLDPTYQQDWPWRICVCPYQMGIWLDTRGDGPADPGGPYGRSAMVSMPWVPDEYHGHTVFAFLVAGSLDNFRPKLEWDGYTWFDGGPWSEYSFRNLIVPLLRSRTDGGDRLTTTQGILIADNAYVCARRGGFRIIDNRIAGKLWNCCLVHDHYPFTTVLADDMMNATWIRVASQSRVQKGSVWWKFNNEDAIVPEGVSLWRHSGVNT